MKTRINNETANPLPPWLPDLLHKNTLFNPLHKLWPFECFHSWPKLEDYNRHYMQCMQEKAGSQPMKFVQESILDEAQLTYEQIIYYHHAVPTRENNWHDFFNYLTWLAWPESKKALNQRTIDHYLTNPQYNFKERKGPLNHLARFEECGLIIKASKQFLHWISQHQWHSVFVQHRDLFHQEVQVYIYGHGLYEKLLNPYKGLTGFAIMLEKDVLQSVDETLAQCIACPDSFQHRNFLQPFPLLGIPGVWPKNANPDFYADESYFRKKRSLA